jgi:hypothetical protein
MLAMLALLKRTVSFCEIMNFKEKYSPILILSYFCGMGLLIAIVLGGARTIIDGIPFFQMLEAPVFMVIVTFFVGILFCEVKARIKSRLLAAILFGILTPQIFILFLFVSDAILGRETKIMLSEYYIITTVVLGTLASMIYLGIVKNKN